jgi:DNA-binding NarL/FixJ family response regulator
VSTPSARIKVLIVDDHEVVRRGLRGFLELQDDLEVVGEAEDGAIAVERADSLGPDVILMDLLMPNLDGLGAIAAIHGAHPEIDIVAVTSFIEEEKVTAALEAGAAGYLLKDAGGARLVSAVESAAAGEMPLAPEVVARLVASYVARPPELPRDAVRLAALSERERDVLALIGAGRSNPEIAAELYISLPTVKSHVRHILAKLDLRDRAQAIVLAHECGLVGESTTR